MTRRSNKPLTPGQSLCEDAREIWCDHQHRIVTLRRVDQLTKRELVSLVERIRSTLWFSEETIEEGGEVQVVNAPNVDDGGVGGADAVDLVVEILGSLDLNPTLRKVA